MKNSIIIVLAAVSVLLTACNKGGSTSGYRVKTITAANMQGKSQVTEFVYSSDNKVSAINLSDSTKVTFTYTGNTVKQTVTSPQLPTPRLETIYLSAAGYMDSSSMSSPMGSATTVNTHDAEGHTTVTKEYYGGTLRRTTESEFKEGNELKRVVSNETMTPLGTIYFEYFADKFNSMAPENQGMKFMGADSKNLMKKVVQVSAKGDTAASITFSYKFDDKGRVISKATYEKGVQADSSNISYY
jgi:hypothetical protein